jgi:hypothetical protein
MPSTLEYARPEPRDRSLALPAFICGVCSGPVAFGLAVIASANNLSGVIAVAVVLGGALAFACIVRGRLPEAAPPRTRRLANVAIVAPIAWSIAILALVLQAHS